MDRRRKRRGVYEYRIAPENFYVQSDMATSNGVKMCVKVSRSILFAATGLLVIGEAAFGAEQQVNQDSYQSVSLFHQLIIAGGPIVWFVLLPLSVLTVYLIADMFISIRASKLVPPSASSAIIDLCNKFPAVQIPVRLKDSDDLLSRAVSRTIEKVLNCRSSVKMQEAGADSLFEQARPLLGRVEWCSMIGNVAPMVGLLGTVYGMIKAFNVLGLSAGQPPADKLASAIAIALITTFWGLAIAIPALVVCGVFRNKIETIVSDAAVELEKILAQIDLNAKRRSVKMTQRPKGKVELISPEGVEVK